MATCIYDKRSQTPPRALHHDWWVGMEEEVGLMRSLGGGGGLQAICHRRLVVEVRVFKFVDTERALIRQFVLVIGFFIS